MKSFKVKSDCKDLRVLTEEVMTNKKFENANKLYPMILNKILNLHLGISPYYKGSGTNYFPLVNNEPQYVGATFMFLDKRDPTRGLRSGSLA